jgi:MarR family transcriptional regulator, negative regulator of the multidrug operon emrRAB
MSDRKSSTPCFSETERRIDATQQRYPAFPRQAAVLVRLIRHVYSEGQDLLNALLREFGLCHSEYGILMMLYGNDGRGINPSELSVASGEKGANLTRICNGLHDRGLIERVSSAEDRRRVVLTLAPKGEALIERLLPVMSVELAQHVAGFDADDMAQMEKLLKRMLTNVEALAARTPE